MYAVPPCPKTSSSPRPPRGSTPPAAAVTISGANTTASWSGSVAISAASLVNMMAGVSGSPASSGDIFWIIEYTTAGNFYLMLANNYGTTTTTTTSYLMPCGAANY